MYLLPMYNGKCHCDGIWLSEESVIFLFQQLLLNVTCKDSNRSINSMAISQISLGSCVQFHQLIRAAAVTVIALALTVATMNLLLVLALMVMQPAPELTEECQRNLGQNHCIFKTSQNVLLYARSLSTGSKPESLNRQIIQPPPYPASIFFFLKGSNAPFFQCPGHLPCLPHHSGLLLINFQNTRENSNSQPDCCTCNKLIVGLLNFL